MTRTELNNRRLEIDTLRALCAIRHHGGITRAATSLGLSQSAVSHKIRRLEVSLDCELLGRKSGGPMLTAAGEDLLDYAGRILGLHDEALLSLSKTPLAGRLLLGLTLIRSVFDDTVERLGHRPTVTFMAWLGTAGLRLLATLFAVCRRRLRGRARCLLRMLHPQHKLNQFVLRQPLQITSIHKAMDSVISSDGKGVSNYKISHLAK